MLSSLIYGLYKAEQIKQKYNSLKQIIYVYETNYEYQFDQNEEIDNYDKFNFINQKLIKVGRTTAGRFFTRMNEHIKELKNYINVY